MDGASVLLVVAALGVSFGWQPDAEDPTAYEVTAQIEPELLDVLKSGQPVPIEAHVPAEVAPIRKVRIVVGNGTLPRKGLATVNKPAERIVRGQEPAPQTYTARYDENDPWTSDRYPTNDAATAVSRQFDQRGATIGSDSIRTAQAPSPWDRAQTAATETGNMLRDGVEAGIQQANQQYQNLTGAAGQSPPSSWPAPPPSISGQANAAPSTTSAATVGPTPSLSASAPPITPVPRSASNTAWSSIRPELAPPRLMNPPLATTNATNSSTAGTRLAANPAGPTIPSLDTRAPLHSVLVDPTTTSTLSQLPPPPSAPNQANASQPNWASGWGSAGTQTAASPATTPIARDPAEEARWDWPTSSASPAVPVASMTATDDRYSQAPPASTSPSGSNDIWAGFPPLQNGAAPNAPTDRFATQPPTNQPAANQPAIGTAPPSKALNATATPLNEQLPWIPLLVVSVSLAGSLGANLFLGWSYADARHRYRSLVRKTTNSFHRATGAAA